MQSPGTGNGSCNADLQRRRQRQDLLDTTSRSISTRHEQFRSWSMLQPYPNPKPQFDQRDFLSTGCLEKTKFDFEECTGSPHLCVSLCR